MKPIGGTPDFLQLNQATIHNLDIVCPNPKSPFSASAFDKDIQLLKWIYHSRFYIMYLQKLLMLVLIYTLYA